MTALPAWAYWASVFAVGFACGGLFVLYAIVRPYSRLAERMLYQHATTLAAWRADRERMGLEAPPLPEELRRKLEAGPPP